MQLLLKIQLDEPLILPVDNHHLIQSVLYNLTRDANGKTSIHDEGARFEKRVYKLFTFGDLHGKKSFRKGTMCFYDEMCLEARSTDGSFVKNIASNIASEGIRFGDRIERNVTVQEENRQINSEDIIIYMDSPVCVYRTDADTGHTRYYSPDDQEFYELILSNFVRKYSAAFGQAPESSPVISKIDVRKADKYLTRYVKNKESKQFIIEAYYGTYRLRGEPEYLDFLYQAGLGAKNSQGFGMFRIVD